MDGESIILSFVPETGEISYDDLHEAVTADRANRDVMTKFFHPMRRRGALVTRLDSSGATVKLYVSRP